MLAKNTTCDDRKPPKPKVKITRRNPLRQAKSRSSTPDCMVCWGGEYYWTPHPKLVCPYFYQSGFPPPPPLPPHKSKSKKMDKGVQDPKAINNDFDLPSGVISFYCTGTTPL